MFKRFCTFAGFNLAMMFMALLALSSVVSAGKMETTIQEAIYLFEMRGETEEAVSLLEKVAAQGDQEDKEIAYFYLGKIQELAGNQTSSNFYYKQSLVRTNEAGRAYWLAERDAATSSQAENFLQTPINIKGRIHKTFGNGPTYCLFQDGSIGRIDEGKITYPPTGIPENSQVIHITSRGVWYQPIDEDSLFFRPFNSSKPRYSYEISKIQSALFQEDHAMLQSSRQLVIIGKKGVLASISEKYDGCTIENFFKPTNEYILNCPDNALHFLSYSDGTENKVITQFDVIQKILVSKNHLFLFSNGMLFCYIPKKSTSPIWKTQVNNIESMFSFGNKLAILESSGTVILLEKNSGLIYSAIKSDATEIHPLAIGTIGLFNEEGSITAVDSVLRPIWHFNFTTPIEREPIHDHDNTYLYFGDRKLYPILPKYYGKRTLQSEIYAQKAAKLYRIEDWDSLISTLDTLFKLEPGNAEGWFFKAQYLENNNGNERDKQNAWSEAVRLSTNNPRITSLILSHYKKAIGAKSISLLPISPKIRYPQLFGSKKDLYTLDPAADRLFCINADNGELRWSKNIRHLENNPVVNNDEKVLVIASGYKLDIYDLTRDLAHSEMQLPGKAFEVKIYDNEILVTTWNGFLLKILRTDYKLAWSRKIYSTPFMVLKNHNKLFTCNLEGEFNALDDNEGQITEGYYKRIQGPITHMVMADSTIALASTNSKLSIFNPYQKDRPPFQILLESSITSLQNVTYESENRILIGLADQSILLYSKDGAPLWKFKGKKSIFTNPCVKDGLAWIDQGNEIISISLKDGTIQMRFIIPGGAGTPFIQNHTLFSTSPKRILYGFSL